MSTFHVDMSLPAILTEQCLSIFCQPAQPQVFPHNASYAFTKRRSCRPACQTCPGSPQGM